MLVRHINVLVLQCAFAACPIVTPALTLKVFAHLLFCNPLFSLLPLASLGPLRLGYYTMHYFFASQSAHVGALYPAFLSMMVASGAPPALAALTLAFNTNLFGGDHSCN